MSGFSRYLDILEGISCSCLTSEPTIAFFSLAIQAKTPHFTLMTAFVATQYRPATETSLFAQHDRCCQAIWNILCHAENHLDFQTWWRHEGEALCLRTAGLEMSRVSTCLLCLTQVSDGHVTHQGGTKRHKHGGDLVGVVLY